MSEPALPTCPCGCWKLCNFSNCHKKHPRFLGKVGLWMKKPPGTLRCAACKCEWLPEETLVSKCKKEGKA